MASNNNPALKRLLTEYKNLNCQPETEFVASPCNDDLFLWHFTIKGQKGTPFEGGIYHGKIVFPAQYPFAPPDIYFFTPNGRFETNTKICFSITSFHPDTWNPAWDVRTALLSIIAFMPTKSNGAIGGIDETDEVRRELAIKSREWSCNECSLKIEPDNIPNSSNNNEKDQKDDSNNKNAIIDDNYSNSQQEIIKSESKQLDTIENGREEEENDPNLASTVADKDDDQEIKLNSNKSFENNDNDNDNFSNDDEIKEEEQEDFYNDLQNINFEELYMVPEIVQNYQNNINRNGSINLDLDQKNFEEEAQKITKSIDYEALIESSKYNKPFVFFPYLEIPIFIIFCVLLVYTYKFHS